MGSTIWCKTLFAAENMWPREVQRLVQGHMANSRAGRTVSNRLLLRLFSDFLSPPYPGARQPIISYSGSPALLTMGQVEMLIPHKRVHVPKTLEDPEVLLLTVLY